MTSKIIFLNKVIFLSLIPVELVGLFLTRNFFWLYHFGVSTLKANSFFPLMEVWCPSGATLPVCNERVRGLPRLLMQTAGVQQAVMCPVPHQGPGNTHRSSRLIKNNTKSWLIPSERECTTLCQVLNHQGTIILLRLLENNAMLSVGDPHSGSMSRHNLCISCANSQYRLHNVKIFY